MTESHSIQEETSGQDVRAARPKVAFEGRPLALALSTALTTITLVLLWPSGNTGAVLVWYSALLAVMATQLWLLLAHRRIAARWDAQLLALVRSRMAADSELERVARMKSEFVSIVSHELRTPLTSLRAALGLIASGGAGPIADKAQPLLQLANRNAERLTILVDDMLDMARIESGTLRVELSPQTLEPIVERALAVNMAPANGRNVALRLTADASGAIVAVDAGRLLQVLRNLLSNAVKFSPQGAYVDVELRANDLHTTIEVRDQGPGIAPEFQPQLFDKFCQGDASDTRVQGGSGLGLAIAKALIEQMGGRIYFTTSDSGTSFFIDLPRWSAASALDDTEREGVIPPVALA